MQIIGRVISIVEEFINPLMTYVAPEEAIIMTTKTNDDNIVPEKTAPSPNIGELGPAVRPPSPPDAACAIPYFLL